MSCPVDTNENAEMLLAYCARKLRPDLVEVLERHMDVCPSCRQFAATQRAVWEALDAWEAAPVSTDFNRRLYRRIDQDAGASIWERLLRPFQPMLVHQGLPIAAAACLLVMAGVLLERPGQVSLPEETQAQVETVQPDQLDRALQDMEMIREFHSIVRSEARPNAI